MSLFQCVISSPSTDHLTFPCYSDKAKTRYLIVETKNKECQKLA